MLNFTRVCLKCLVVTSCLFGLNTRKSDAKSVHLTEVVDQSGAGEYIGQSFKPKPSEDKANHLGQTNVDAELGQKANPSAVEIAKRNVFMESGSGSANRFNPLRKKRNANGESVDLPRPFHLPNNEIADYGAKSVHVESTDNRAMYDSLLNDVVEYLVMLDVLTSKELRVLQPASQEQKTYKRGFDSLGGVHIPYEKRNFDSLGGGHVPFEKKSFDSLGGHHIPYERSFDSLGGGHVPFEKRGVDSLGGVHLPYDKRHSLNKAYGTSIQRPLNSLTGVDVPGHIRRSFDSLGGSHIPFEKRGEFDNLGGVYVPYY